MKLNDAKDVEKLTELLSQAEGHPIIQKIKAEARAEILKKRQDASGKIETLKKQRDEILPKLQADLAKKEENYRQAKAAADAAANEFNKVKAGLFTESHKFAHGIDQQSNVLYETADPLIDETIQFFRDKIDDLRKPGRISRIAGGSERNVHTMEKKVKVESNINAINRALSYCRDSILALELLKLSPMINTELSELIEKLKSGIPRIDVFEETTKTIPLPGSRGVNPLHLLPSDSEMDWKIGKLTEKFKKLMVK